MNSLIRMRSLCCSFFPVMLGGLIYTTYRDSDLLMFTWYDTIGLTRLIEQLRVTVALFSDPISDWIIFSLPNALWMFSFIHALLWVWDFKLERRNLGWMLLATGIGIGTEIGQWVHVVPGTFDPTDLWMLIVATFLPIFFIRDSNLYHKTS